MIGIHFKAEGHPDDPLWLTPPSPLDAPMLRGPLDKERREDLQTLSFMLAVSLVGNGVHPLEVAKGTDPPDRVITTDGVKHAVELTELTVFEIRRDLAQARQLGRLMKTALTRDTRRFGHLFGRSVVLAVVPMDGDQLQHETLIHQICTVLEVDRGCVGDGIDVSAGLPENWPNDRGFYGKHGPVIVMCYRDGSPDAVLVSASCQAQISLSQTIEAVNTRIQAKDREGNDVLLMSCGMPDQTGHVCPADQFMFQFIEEHRARIRPSPTHLKRVLLHLWGTAKWIELFRAHDAAALWPPHA